MVQENIGIQLRFGRIFGAGVLCAFAWFVVGGVSAQEAAPPDPAPSAAQSVETSVPNLELSATFWDFGEKWSGEKAETTVTLKNTGTAVLKIDQVKSSCGCTVAQAKKKELAPGETEDIQVSYNTRKNAENVSQKIRIMTNDPDTPTAMFEVKGHVKQLIKMDGGPNLIFGNVSSAVATTKSAEFECAYTEPLELRLKENPAANLDIRLETLESGKRYKLVAVTKPPLQDGNFYANAVLETGLELMPEIHVRISGIAQGPVSVNPKVLYLMGGQNVPTTRMLRVTSLGEKPINVTSVKADLDAIQAEILPQPDDPAALKNPNSAVTLIQVKLPPAGELPDQEVALRITTDDPEYKELIVPIQKRTGRTAARPTTDGTTTARPIRPRPSISVPQSPEK